MIVLYLVKTECFKDYLDIFWVIEEYSAIITYLESFYCIDFIQFIKVLYKVIDLIFCWFFVYYLNILTVFEWARQCPKKHNLSSNDHLLNPFLCLQTFKLKNVWHHFWSQVVHLRNINQKQLRKNWICVNFFNLE